MITEDIMKKNLQVHLLAFLTVLIWASAFPFTRAIGGQIGAFSLVFIRCFFGFLALLLIGLFTGIRKPFRAKDHGWFFLAGILGFSAYLVCFNLGLETLDSATASIISATCPIFTAIAAMKLYHEKINAAGWITMIGAFAGVVILLVWDNGLSIKIGTVWIIILSILFAGYNILGRKFTSLGYTSQEAVTYSTMWGAVQSLFFLPQTIHDMARASAQANIAAIALGILATGVAYSLWGKALSLTDKTSKVANYIFLNPLIATIVGFLLLHEVPTAATYVGGIIIIACVVIFTLKGTPQEN